MARPASDWVRFEDFRDQPMVCIVLERRDEQHFDLGRIFQDEGPVGIERLIGQWTYAKYPGAYCIGIHPLPERGAWGFLCVHPHFPERPPAARLPLFYVRTTYEGLTVEITLDDGDGDGY